MWSAILYRILYVWDPYFKQLRFELGQSYGLVYIYKAVKEDLHSVWLRFWMTGSIFSLKAILPRVGASLLKNSSKPPCYYRVLWPRVNFSLQDQSNRLERDSFGTAHMLGCCSVHISLQHGIEIGWKMLSWGDML